MNATIDDLKRTIQDCAANDVPPELIIGAILDLTERLKRLEKAVEADRPIILKMPI